MPKNINAFQQVITNTFPIKQQNPFQLYPTSNELSYKEILLQIEALSLHKDDAKMKVALLFGESNCLSILPTLAKFTDVVLLADVEANLHTHTKYMLDVFNESSTPAEFLNNYLEKHPLLPSWENGAPLSMREIHDMFNAESTPCQSLKEYHFLSSQERYEECKQALKQVAIQQISFDLLDESACATMADLLTSHNGQFVLCNFTNIHQYDYEDSIVNSTAKLLSNAKEAMVMYCSPTPALHATLVMGLNQYQENCFPKRIARANFFHKSDAKVQDSNTDLSATAGP